MMDQCDRNFARLYKMVGDVCHSVFWEIFLEMIKLEMIKLENPSFTKQTGVKRYVEEAFKKKKIPKDLKNRYEKMLHMWKEIGTETAIESDFDMNSLCSLILDIWDKQKGHSHYKVVKDSVLSLKDIRNELAHSSSLSIECGEYNRKMFEIRTNVDILESSISELSPNRGTKIPRHSKKFLNKIDRIHNDDFDSELLKKLIKQWKKELKIEGYNQENNGVVEDKTSEECTARNTESTTTRPASTSDKNTLGCNVPAFEMTSAAETVKRAEEQFQIAETNLKDVKFKMSHLQKGIKRKDETINQQTQKITQLQDTIEHDLIPHGQERKTQKITSLQDTIKHDLIPQDQERPSQNKAQLQDTITHDLIPQDQKRSSQNKAQLQDTITHDLIPQDQKRPSQNKAQLQDTITHHLIPQDQESHNKDIPMRFSDKKEIETPQDLKIHDAKHEVTLSAGQRRGKGQTWQAISNLITKDEMFHKQMMDTHQKTHRDQLENLTSLIVTSIEDRKNAVTNYRNKEILKAQEEYNREYTYYEKTHKEIIRRTKEIQANELQCMEQKLKSELKELRNEYEKYISYIHQDNTIGEVKDTKIKDMKNKTDEREDFMKKKYREQIEDLKQQYKTDISKMEKEFKDSKSKREKMFKEKADGLWNECEKHIERLNSQV